VIGKEEQRGNLEQIRKSKTVFGVGRLQLENATYPSIFHCLSSLFPDPVFFIITSIFHFIPSFPEALALPIRLILTHAAHHHCF